ncbi:MAG: fucose isomerase [bacterium]
MKTTFGIIVGNRGFFPKHLCESGRGEILAALEEAGYGAVTLDAADTPCGSVETIEDARKCAKLFDERRHEIDGVIVTLPNFGDERAIANTLRWSSLRVPVLIHAFPDTRDKMTLQDRRDSFCGKMSVCNNLCQYGIPFSLTQLHTVGARGARFRADLDRFAAVCRVVRGLRNLRIGALGARPAAFNTVRFSEKLLEQSGISVETLDLHELLGWAGRLQPGAPEVQAKLKAILEYVPATGIPEAALIKMAQFGAAVDRWMSEQNLQATAIQCWTAMEEFFGIVPCTCMSMMSNNLAPSACEVDVMGAVAMRAMTLASGRPSALVDWNNNYGDDPDKCVFFHCSNLPMGMFACEGCKPPVMDFQEIIAGSVGKDNSYGAIVGRIKDESFTFLRVSTDEAAGVVRVYTGEGTMTRDPLDTFGGYGVAHIPQLQKLLRFICSNGFEHHVAINLSACAEAVNEALGNYLGWDVRLHE